MSPAANQRLGPSTVILLIVRKPARPPLVENPARMSARPSGEKPNSSRCSDTTHCHTTSPAGAIS
mgnify:CR=1 FL=1